MLDYILEYIRTHPWYFVYPDEEFIKCIESAPFQLSFLQTLVVQYIHHGIWIVLKVLILLLPLGLGIMLRRAYHWCTGTQSRPRESLVVRFRSWARKLTRGKRVSYKHLVVVGAEPWIQKVGIVGALLWWKQVGPMGLVAVWCGGCIRITLYPLFYALFGGAIASWVMNVVMFIVGFIIIVKWLRKNGTHVQ